VFSASFVDALFSPPLKNPALDFLGEAGMGTALDLSETGGQTSKKIMTNCNSNRTPSQPPPFSKTENGGGA
ncbi:MAG: hypothetical protein WCP19_06720, partial [Chloroflexota bacterium]